MKKHLKHVFFLGVILAILAIGSQGYTADTPSATPADQSTWRQTARSVSTKPEQNLPGKDFSKQILTMAQFDKSNLIGANFYRAVLSESSFKWADLSHANLNGAQLIGADFRHANLNGADLANADLTNATVKGAYFKNATYNEHTFFPDGFVPGAHGMVFKSDK
jgi:uncharacterized protein YjbI with pentapeptide repeats